MTSFQLSLKTPVPVMDMGRSRVRADSFFPSSLWQLLTLKASPICVDPWAGERSSELCHAALEKTLHTWRNRLGG